MINKKHKDAFEKCEWWVYEIQTFLHVKWTQVVVVTVNVLDCNIVVSEFEHQSGCCVHFEKGTNSLTAASYESNRTTTVLLGPVGWGRKIHQRMSWYDTKQSDGEVPVILELWRIWSTPSLPSLPDPLCTGVVAPDRVLSMGQIELISVLMLNRSVWNKTVFVS